MALIIGTAGVGKTALAVQFAADNWDLFPDGQLFTKMEHPDGHPSPALMLLSRFIRAIGFLDEQLPDSLEARRSLYLSLTAGWRGLVIIDDACHQDCVAKLLPSGHSCAAIVTSRADLKDLQAHRIELEPLHEKDAIDLLEAVIGEERVHADRSAALKIAGSGHPLSVRLAGSALVNRPYLPLKQAVTRMEEQRPLPYETPRAVLNGRLDLSYALLTREERKVFRCVGLLRQSVVSPWELAALLNIDEEDAIDEEKALRLADNLAQAQLVRRSSGGRAGIVKFEIHQHVLEYAHARMLAETVERTRRRRRVALDLAREDRRRSADSLQWRLNITIPSWKDEGRLDKALDEARDALSIAEDSERARETALALAILGDLQVELGNTDEALEMAEASLKVDPEHRSVRALRCLGKVMRRMRRLEIAQTYLAEALEAAHDTGDVSEEIRILVEQSAVLALTPERLRSVTVAEEATALCLKHPEHSSLLTAALWAHGNALVSCGQSDSALVYLDEGARTASDDQALWRTWVHWLRGKAALDVGELAKAAESETEAIDGFGAMAHRYGVAYCKLMLGRVYVADGSCIDEAIALLADALETFQNCNDLWTQGDAKHVLALAMLQVDNRTQATRLLQDAERVFVELDDEVSLAAVHEDLESSRRGLNRHVLRQRSSAPQTIGVRKGG